MKKCYILSILFFLLLSVNEIAGKRRDSNPLSNDYYHFVYATASGGFSSFSELNTSNITTYGDVGGLVGLGYEMRVNHFWLSVGGDVAFYDSKSQVNLPYETNHDALDTQGKNIVMHYDITKQQDQQKWIYAGIPLMFGGYYDMFYAGVGVKVGFPISRTTTTSVSYTTSATYPQYIDDFGEMANHYYGNYDTLIYTNASLRTNISLIGEIGIDVLARVYNKSHYCNILKIGFYFEYGCYSLVDPGYKTDRITFPSNNALEVIANPHYNWKENSSYKCNPYFLGLKVTYMFGGSNTRNSAIHHKGCMCYQ